ncbi:hypothetical protein I4U23_015964 [Adineta vaga]|nr:hypothetical protein I4U23_015964 [Adineta vaga]
MTCNFLTNRTVETLYTVVVIRLKKINKSVPFFLFAFIMPKVNSEQNIDNDDLICPITMELFRDPVIANDGRVYERAAITQWITEHGTSPFTREPLQVNELQPDDYLRQLAARRRNSVVSYNAQHSTVILPPLRTGPRNTRRIHPEETTNAPSTEPLNGKHRNFRICLTCSCGLIILGAIIAGFTLVFRSSSSSINGNGSSYSASISSNIVFNVTTSFSDALTTMSSTYTRPTGWSAPYYLYYYTVHKIFVNTTGYYEIRSSSIIDLYGYLYRESFNATQPTVNLLMQNDDSGGSQQFRIRSDLSSSVYDLVVTTYSARVTGSFRVSVGGPAAVTIQ